MRSFCSSRSVDHSAVYTAGTDSMLSFCSTRETKRNVFRRRRRAARNESPSGEDASPRGRGKSHKSLAASIVPTFYAVLSFLPSIQVPRCEPGTFVEGRNGRHFNIPRDMLHSLGLLYLVPWLWSKLCFSQTLSWLVGVCSFSRYRSSASLHRTVWRCRRCG